MVGAAEPVLLAEEVTVRFDGLVAVDAVSLECHRGRVTGLIGPNGAGKTTLFNAITGHQTVTHGAVRFLGRDVTRTPAHTRARMGIARTFQLGGCIPDLSVLENVVLGLDLAARAGRGVPRHDRVHAARELLVRFALDGQQDALVSSLSAGLRREVEIARALASGSRLLLLDEPGVGLTEAERERLSRLVRQVAADHDTAFLVTDHNTDLIFSVADRVIAMNFGSTIAEGAPGEVQASAAVLDAYLGLAEVVR